MSERADPLTPTPRGCCNLLLVDLTDRIASRALFDRVLGTPLGLPHARELVLGDHTALPLAREPSQSEWVGGAP